MKIGKVPENVLKRSVLKQLKTKRDEVVFGAGIGEDCAVLSFREDEAMVLSTDPITGTAKDIGRLAIQVNMNDIAAAGAEPVGILLSALLPEGFEEEALKGIVAQVEEICAKLHVQVAGGHTEVTAAVNQPVLTVTGIGKIRKGVYLSPKNIRPGQDVVVSKWIGLEGTSILAKEREDELLGRYPSHLISEAKAFDRYLSIVPEAAVAVKSGVCAMHDITEGGVFGALWEVAEAAGVGLTIDLRQIPVKQETIEICNFFDINPYELISSGSLLMVADNGYDLARRLKEAGIPASVIGKTTDSRDRVVIKEEEKRFLVPPGPDALYAALAKKF